MYLKFKKLVLMPFGSLCAVYLASTNDKGLVFNDAVSLSASGATLFYWFVAAVGFFMTFRFFRADFEQRRVASSNASLAEALSPGTHDG